MSEICVLGLGYVGLPTASLLATAREKRAPEQDANNKIIFDLIDDLIQRALEHF